MRKKNWKTLRPKTRGTLITSRILVKFVGLLEPQVTPPFAKAISK